MRRRVVQASLGVVLLLSGCAQEEGGDAVDSARDTSAEVSADAGANTGTPKPPDEAEDRTAEARQKLTRWEICYKLTYALSKAACTKTHLPADYCHYLADGAATVACRPLIGLAEEGVPSEN